MLSGCNMGPKYNKPAIPAPPAYKESAPAAYCSAPDAWRPAKPQDAVLKGKWWEMFHETELNALEERLNIDNQNIAQYFQNFMAARALVREARASYFPTVTVNPAISGTHTGGSSYTVPAGGTTGTAVAAAGSGGNSYNLYSLPLGASWEPDLFGRIRNTVSEYRYASQVSAADLENERLTEQADLAVYYFELRGQDALQDLYNRTIAAYRNTLELTRTLAETGIDSQEDVAAAAVTLASAEEAGTGMSRQNRKFRFPAK